jgi:hypothetical protein
LLRALNRRAAPTYKLGRLSAKRSCSDPYSTLFAPYQFARFESGPFDQSAKKVFQPLFTCDSFVLTPGLQLQVNCVHAGVSIGIHRMLPLIPRPVFHRPFLLLFFHLNAGIRDLLRDGLMAHSLLSQAQEQLSTRFVLMTFATVLIKSVHPLRFRAAQCFAKRPYKSDFLTNRRYLYGYTLQW